MLLLVNAVPPPTISPPTLNSEIKGDRYGEYLL